MADQTQEIKARKAFVAGRYDEAIDLFAQLYAETLHPIYLRNLGRCHQKLGHASEAIGFFRDYLRKLKSIQAAERTEIEEYISEMEVLKKQKADEVRPAGASAPATAAAVESEVPGPVVAQPGPAPVLIAAPAAPPVAIPIYRRWWFWAGAAAVVAGAVVASITLSQTTINRPGCPEGIPCK